MQNNQNSFQQLQNLITQISSHVYQINEIIIQMNNIINQMHYPNINQMNNLMGQMNNYIKNQINFNQNFPNFNEMNIPYFNIENKNFNDNIFIKFIKDGDEVGINIDKNRKIEELLELYFKRMGLNDFNKNFNDKFIILYNGKNILKSKEKKNKEILTNCCIITDRYLK